MSVNWFSNAALLSLNTKLTETYWFAWFCDFWLLFPCWSESLCSVELQGGFLALRLIQQWSRSRRNMNDEDGFMRISVHVELTLLFFLNVCKIQSLRLNSVRFDVKCVGKWNADSFTVEVTGQTKTTRMYCVCNVMIYFRDFFFTMACVLSTKTVPKNGRKSMSQASDSILNVLFYYCPFL